MTAGMISSWRLARSQQLSREKRPLTAHSVVTMQGRSAASGDGSKGSTTMLLPYHHQGE